MFGGLGTKKGERYRLCLKVFAVGDINGVGIARQVHESISMSEGALKVSNLFRFSGASPDSDCWQMLLFR